MRLRTPMIHPTFTLTLSLTRWLDSYHEISSHDGRWTDDKDRVYHKMICSIQAIESCWSSKEASLTVADELVNMGALVFSLSSKRRKRNRRDSLDPFDGLDWDISVLFTSHAYDDESRALFTTFYITACNICHQKAPDVFIYAKHLFTNVVPSVRPSVGPSVRPELLLSDTYEVSITDDVYRPYYRED